MGWILTFKDNLSYTPTGRPAGNNGLREIEEFIDSPTDRLLPPTSIALANQIADYYLAAPAHALRLMLPPSPPHRATKRFTLTELGQQALKESRLSDLQTTVLTRLSRTAKGLTLPTLKRTVEHVMPVLTGLQRRKWIQTSETHSTSSRTVLSQKTNPPEGPYGSNSEQPASISPAIRSKGKRLETSWPAWWSSWRELFQLAWIQHRYEERLLYASSSIQRACLYWIIQQARASDRNILILTPEINQATDIFTHLQSELANQVILFHGGLSGNRRHQLWQQIREGHVRVVVGTRSALFVPLPSLGVIWIEQEEDASLKEEQNPYYHARDVARMRAKLEKAIVILASSLPSLETVHRLGHDVPSLLNPSQEISTPPIHVVNLQQSPYGTILSEPMINGMKTTLEQGGRMILFLNRKGFSKSITCKDCGYVPRCPACGVVLMMYKKPPRLACSYCGQSQPLPTDCPSCQSTYLEPGGIGTERIEEFVMKHFPTAGVGRFDRDTIHSPTEDKALCRDFQSGHLQIIIGTELLFHSQFMPSVQFLGIPFADTGLHIPDFRSAERTFHLLQKAINLVDTQADHAKIVIQTYMPSHHVIRAVTQHTPSLFYQEELDFRKALGYPPFTHIIQIALSGKHGDRVQQTIKQFAQKLRLALGKRFSPKEHSLSEEQLLGPIPSIRVQPPGKFRWFILIKTPHIEAARPLVRGIQKNLEDIFTRHHLALEINVDPIQIG